MIVYAEIVFSVQSILFLQLQEFFRLQMQRVKLPEQHLDPLLKNTNGENQEKESNEEDFDLLATEHPS